MAVNLYNEPNWSVITPEVYPGKSAFGIKATSHTMLTGMIVNLLQYHFSDVNNIENNLLQSYLWNANSSLSKIYINTAGSRDTSVSSQLPGLFVQRGPAKKVLNNLLRSGIGITIDTLDVDTEFCAIWEGNHTILCEALTEDSAEALSEEVWRRMLYFSPSMQADFGLNYLDVISIGAGSSQNTGGLVKSYITPVTMAWSKTYTWTLPSK